MPGWKGRTVLNAALSADAGFDKDIVIAEGGLIIIRR